MGASKAKGTALVLGAHCSGPQRRTKRRSDWTARMGDRFCETLAETCNVTLAAEAIGRSIGNVYKWRGKDASFRVAWDRALAVGYSRLELMLLERALHGVEKVVVARDGTSSVMREYAAQLDEVFRRNPIGQRAVRLVAGMVGGLPIYAADGQADAVALVTREGLLEEVAAGLLLHGNAYVQLVADSHDQALAIAGTLFRPSPAITPAAVRLRAGLEAQRGEVEGALSAAALSEHDLEAGRWDGARVSLIAVDWQEPDGEQVTLAGGGLGPVSIKDGGFSAELVGAADALSAPACPETSPECRADLGDHSCRVDLAGRREMFAVASFGGGTVGFDRAVDGRFLFGEALVLDGENAGWRSRIIAVAANAVVLRDVPLFAVAAGCRVRLTEGCDKRFATCATRFANGVSFRGEPHLPGNDLLTRYPGG